MAWEQAFEALTHRVEELAAALQDERVKHHDALETLRLQIERSTQGPRPTTEESFVPQETLHWAALKSEILQQVRAEQEAFKDRYLLETQNCLESVKNLELSMGHVSRELSQLRAPEASPLNRPDSIICSAKTTLEGAFLEARDGEMAQGREMSCSRLSTVTAQPGGDTGLGYGGTTGVAPRGGVTPPPPAPPRMYFFQETPPQRMSLPMRTPIQPTQPMQPMPQRRSLPVSLQRVPGPLACPAGNNSVPVPRAQEELKRMFVVPQANRSSTAPRDREPQRATITLPFKQDWKAVKMLPTRLKVLPQNGRA